VDEEPDGFLDHVSLDCGAERGQGRALAMHARNRSWFSHLLVVGSLLALTACPSRARGPEGQGEYPATLSQSPDSGKVDRVGPDDGALKPDGTNDVSFVVEVDGPIKAVFLVSVGEDDSPTGRFQADTLVGDEGAPLELGGKAGGRTFGLAVAEGDKIVNRADGSLPPLGPGAHHLVLYVSPSPQLEAVKKLRVYLVRPDDTVLAGAVLSE
jgi:hypothetical protein